MSDPSRVTRTAAAVARRRALITTVLVLIGATLSMTVTAFAMLHASSTAAIRESVEANFGHRPFLLQSADPTVAAKAARNKGLKPVVDDDGTLSTHDLTTDVLVRSTTDADLELGALTAGRRPGKPGETLISEVIARSLGIHVGDRVAVKTANGVATRAKVTGLLVDPSDSSAQLVVQVVAPSPEFKPTRWLADFNPAQDPDLGPSLSPPASVVVSLRGAVAAALESQPHVISTLRFLPAGAAATLGLLLLGFSAGLAVRWRPTALTLQAAGMTGRASWLVFVEWVTAAVVFGQALGVGLALLALTTFKRPVSGWFHQAWVGVAVPTWTIVLLAAATAAVATAALPCLQRITASTRASSARDGVRRPADPWLLALWLAAAGYWVYLAFIDDSGADQSMLTSVLVGTAAVALTPYALEPLIAKGLTPSVRSMYRALVGQMRLVAALAASVVFLSGLWSAQTSYAAAQSQESDIPLQPPNSLLLSGTPDDSVSLIAEVYSKYGGHQVRTLQIPDETAHVVRVTSPALVGCVNDMHAKSPEEVPSSCWPDPNVTNSPINQIALGTGDSVLTERGLIQNGKAGLLDFDNTTPDGPITDALSVPAQPDPELGGSVVGMVVPADGPIARRYQLKPSGVSQMMLLDYGTLTPEERLRVRSEVTRLTPTALVEDSTGPSAYDGMRSAAASGGLFGAAGAGLLLLLGGYASIQTAGAARRALQDLGAVPRVRWSLIARWLAVPALSALLAGVVAYATVSFGGRVVDFSYGPLWAAPVVATLLVVAILAAWFARPATHEWDVSEA